MEGLRIRSKQRALLLSSALLISAGPALAKEAKAESASFTDNLFGSLTVSYSRNVYHDDSYKANRSYGTNFSLGYRNENQQRFVISSGASYALDGEEGWHEQDVWLSTSKSGLFKPTEWLSVSGDARLALPVSEQSRKDKLRTRVRGALTFGFDLSDWAKGLSFTAQPRLLKNFHKNKTAGGRNLTEYSLSALYSLSYARGDWHASFTAINTHNWTYKGTYTHPRITLSQDISYKFADNWTVGLGHTNSASYFDPDKGPDPILDLLDFKRSTFYGTLNYSF